MESTCYSLNMPLYIDPKFYMYARCSYNNSIEGIISTQTLRKIAQIYLCIIFFYGPHPGMFLQQTFLHISGANRTSLTAVDF